MMRSLFGIALCGLLLVPAVASGQGREYVTHQNYTPTNGEDAQAAFASAYPGKPVADRPGFVWKHDGRGWYFELASTPTPVPPPNTGAPPPFENLPPVCLPWPNPYTEQARVIQCNAALGPVLPTKSIYRVGDHYARPYSPERMVVLSISRGLDETVVITAQWLTNSPTYVDFAYKDPPHVAGDVFAFKPGKDDQWQSTSGASMQ